MQNQHAQGIRALRSPHITFKQNGNDTEKNNVNILTLLQFFFYQKQHGNDTEKIILTFSPIHKMY